MDGLRSQLSHKLRNLLALPRRDWATLAAAWGLLVGVDLALRLLPYSLGRRLLPDGSGEPPSRGSHRVLPEAERCARLVGVAGRHHLWNMTCLRRAIVLCRLLARRDIPAVLRIGARRSGGGIAAHAWVEVQGVPLDNPPDIADRYPVLLPVEKGLRLESFQETPQP